MSHNQNRSLKRSNSSPAILKPNKRQKFGEVTPPPLPSPELNQDVEFENDVEPIGQNENNGDDDADVEDNTGSDSDDAYETGDENEDEEEGGDGESDDEGEYGNGDDVDQDPWVHDMIDLEAEENGEITSSDTSSSGPDDGDDMEDDDRFAHNSSSKNPYPDY